MELSAEQLLLAPDTEAEKTREQPSQIRFCVTMEAREICFRYFVNDSRIRIHLHTEKKSLNRREYEYVEIYAFAC